jgi:predicted nuclease of predicted toxin-antitoxin system
VNIKLDENLPIRLVPFLSDLGHNVDTVPQEGLTGLDDSTVWHAAQQSGRFSSHKISTSPTFVDTHPEAIMG